MTVDGRPLRRRLKLSRNHDNKGLVLGAPTVHDKSLGCGAALVASEMRCVGGEYVGFAGPEWRRRRPLHFHDQISLHDVEDFLSARMHVPRRRAAWPEFGDADYAFLYDLALALQISAQDLRKLWCGGRALGRCDGCHASDRDSGRGKMQELATNEFHSPPPSSKEIINRRQHCRRRLATHTTKPRANSPIPR